MAKDQKETEDFSQYVELEIEQGERLGRMPRHHVMWTYHKGSLARRLLDSAVNLLPVSSAH